MREKPGPGFMTPSIRHSASTASRAPMAVRIPYSAAFTTPVRIVYARRTGRIPTSRQRWMQVRALPRVRMRMCTCTRCTCARAAFCRMLLCMCQHVPTCICQCAARDEYNKLFFTFGTHFVNDMDLGGKVVATRYVSKSAYNEVRVDPLSSSSPSFAGT